MAFTIDKNFGNWLAGFADGEGCFHIGKNGQGARFCQFRIALHQDDFEILQKIYEATGLGKVWVGKSPSMKSPAAYWTVNKKDECLRLVELFEQFPLRAKKSKDFEIWAKAVRIHQFATQGKKNSVDRIAIDDCREKLRLGRPSRGKGWS